MSFINSQNSHDLQDRDVYQYSSLYTPQTPYRHNYITDQNSVCPEESTFWCNSPRSDSPSPDTSGQHGSLVGPYQIYTPISFTSSEHLHYRTGYITNAEGLQQEHISTPVVRVVKRRNTANKKERRRTQSINNAYADLRDCIPNVPPDTKLSKIKTLRLATSYISYLTGVLETDDPMDGFRAELGNSTRRSHSSMPHNSDCQQVSPRSPHNSDETSVITGGEGIERRRGKGKGRTGWPQHVWALELKNEQSL